MPRTVDSASTSISASTCSFDVFINHRGSDVKKNIASHLYHRLLSHGLRVFLDEPELERGEEFPPQIAGAIATASVHLAIFSPGYANSTWCLRELVDMLKWTKSGAATIIPVFYRVDPSDLRREDKGKYAEDLRHLEKKRRYDQKTIEEWKAALAEVSTTSGFTLEGCNSDEGELVEMVAQKVLKKVRKPPLPVPAHLTGLDEKLQDFEKTVLLEQQHQRGKSNVVAIVGPGGLGKTTLATVFFNRKRSDYKRACFLPDVKEDAAKKSLEILQTKLYKDLSGQDQLMDNVSEGIAILSDRLSRCKGLGQALIVLDNVDDDKHLDALFSPLKDVLPSGSLIIVTSRNPKVFARPEIEKPSFYKMKGLDKELSRVLFCSYAFGQRGPAEGFEEIVRKFLDVCAGLPLSLKVLGALLHGEKLKSWEAHLNNISKAGLPTDLQRTLKSSYDSLDKDEREIFKDIACFFTGMARNTAIRIWEESGWSGWLGFRNLEKKCLVEVDSNKCIRMHDHLRELGRHLAEKEPPCRLSIASDELFPNVPTPSTSTVRGISVVQQGSGESFQNPVDFAKRMVDMSGLQLLRAPGNYLTSISIATGQQHLLWLRCESYTASYLPSWIPWHNLRVLEVEGRESEVEGVSCLETLWETEIEAPLKLRELNIRFSLLRVPKSIGKLKYLEKVELHNIIETLPEEFSDLRSLKHLKLCGGMISLPNSLGNLTKLQHLDLSWCHKLQMLPPSFGRLTQLKHLSLEHCLLLTVSPETFGNITTLKRLNLSYCQKIKMLPSQVTHQRSLKELILKGTELEELPSDIGKLGELKILEITCSPLKNLPDSLSQLTSLEQLTLKSCRDIRQHFQFGELKRLIILRMIDLPISFLAGGMAELNKLEILEVENCPLSEFFAIPGQDYGESWRHRYKRRSVYGGSRDHSGKIVCGLPGLRRLYLRSTRIRGLSFGEGACRNLQTLDLRGSAVLEEVGALPTTLVSLGLPGCRRLKKLTGLSGLSKLRTLDMRMCVQVQVLPGLETLESLEEFRTSKCENMKKIRVLARAANPGSDILKNVIQLMETQEVE